MQSCDALVIGGGPAGLAAGIALRLRGLDVVVADALTPPIDKACGEGLMPDSRQELAILGVDLRGGREFSGLHFANRNRRREDLVWAKFASGSGLGVRRAELHRSLIDRAAELGVRLKWSSRATLSGSGKASLYEEDYRYRYLIAADGSSSAVRRTVGLEASSFRATRLGLRRHYRIAPWSDHVEVHWGGFGQAYITPVADDEICVAATTRHRGFQFDSLLRTMPYLHAKLSAQTVIGRDRGAVTVTRKLRRVTCGNVALVGDASGSADAIVGQGLACAFRQALLLGEALGKDSIESYEAGHASILQLPRRMASAMLVMDRWPIVRDWAMRTFAGHPDLFAYVLAHHLGESHNDSREISARLLRILRRSCEVGGDFPSEGISHGIQAQIGGMNDSTR